MEPSNHAGASDEAAPHAEPKNSPRRQDPIDKPARSLGVKRAALQQRRHRQIEPNWHAGVTSFGRWGGAGLLASSDGTLEFAIQPIANGLMIEKRFWQPSGHRTAQALFFRGTADFDRWCDLEPVRFEDPVLHGELRRQGRAVLEQR